MQVASATLVTANGAFKSSVAHGLQALSLLVASATSDFRDSHPFITSKDFLAYMREGRQGDQDDAISRYNQFAAAYPMYKLSPRKMDLLLDYLSRSCAGRTDKGYNILEIGSFYGYSALNIALNMPAGAQLTLVEANAESCEVIREVLDRALLGSKRSEVRSRIKLINGLSSRVISGGELNPVRGFYDFVFMDHDKSSYLKDLLLLEERGLVGRGTVLAADNVVFPGAPDYVARVTGDSARYDTQIVPAPFERVAFETGFEEVADGMAFTTLLM